MMFLFAGHSDKPLKSLISMAHKGNHICLYRFSFHKPIKSQLVRGRLYLPFTTCKSTTESAFSFTQNKPAFSHFIL